MNLLWNSSIRIFSCVTIIQFGVLGTIIIENQNELTHRYNDTGKYVVLTIENEYGCVDSTQKTVYINPVFSIYIPTENSR